MLPHLTFESVRQHLELLLAIISQVTAEALLGTEASSDIFGLHLIKLQQHRHLHAQLKLFMNVQLEIAQVN